MAKSTPDPFRGEHPLGAAGSLTGSWRPTCHRLLATLKSLARETCESLEWRKRLIKMPASTCEVYRQAMARLPELLHRTLIAARLAARRRFRRAVSARFHEPACSPATISDPVLGLLHRRRRHQAESRHRGRRSRHGRHRPGGDERERCDLLRGGAAVFSRLCGHVARRSRAARADRLGGRGRVHRERLRVARRRDGDPARSLSAAAITIWRGFAWESSSGGA